MSAAIAMRRAMRWLDFLPAGPRLPLGFGLLVVQMSSASLLKRLKIVVDITAFFFVTAYFASEWCDYLATLGYVPRVDDKVIIIPSICGLAWLSLQFGPLLRRRYPNAPPKWLLPFLFVFIGFLVLPVYLKARLIVRQ
jgi:hypothetical protein